MACTPTLLEFPRQRMRVMNTAHALLERESGANATTAGVGDAFTSTMETNPSAYFVMLVRMDCMLLPV
jgi:hypothetical protein